MNVIEHRREDYLISTDKARLDLAFIHDYLSRSTYWAPERPFAIVAKSVEHSLCFGLYTGIQ